MEGTEQKWPFKMSSIQKVLISFEEYSRLKDIEDQFNELSKKYQELQDKNINESTQTGAGSSHKLSLNSTELKHIVDLVKQEITVQPQKVDKTWQNYELSPPTVVALGHPQQKQLSVYDIEKTKTDLNDKFDEKRLLKKVPKEFRSKAEELLAILEERSSDLTFDSTGDIFINEESIPGSNIFKFFPLLFKKKSPKKFTGYQEFVQKLIDMGLGRFIQYPIDQSKAMKFDKALDKEISPKQSDQWWYLD